jgi:hypothetical protein
MSISMYRSRSRCWPRNWAGNDDGPKRFLAEARIMRRDPRFAAGPGLRHRHPGGRAPILRHGLHRRAGSLNELRKAGPAEPRSARAAALCRGVPGLLEVLPRAPTSSTATSTPGTCCSAAADGQPRVRDRRVWGGQSMIAAVSARTMTDQAHPPTWLRNKQPETCSSIGARTIYSLDRGLLRDADRRCAVSQCAASPTSWPVIRGCNRAGRSPAERWPPTLDAVLIVWPGRTRPCNRTWPSDRACLLARRATDNALLATRA